ncbi:MAG: hypothetical protein AAF081_18665 [Actinomycetota bacterium]
MSSTRLHPPTTIPHAAVSTPVEGLNIAAGASLGDVLGSEPTLLVFLRHHG